MTRARYLIGILILILLCWPTAQAQQSNSASKEADEAVRQKALDLLESLAGQISILQSAENRARVGANIADSLWDHDERRARNLLISVQEDINAGLQKQEGERPENTQRRMVFLQLRINTVERITRHDGELALAFFKATEAPPDALRPSYEPDLSGFNERALELRLAQQVAAQNPEVALNLARQSLATGFSNDILPLLRRLKRNHPTQASTLYGEIVAKLKGVNLLRDQNFYFAQNLAREYAPSTSDDSVFRDLMRIFIDFASANGCDNKTVVDAPRGYLCYQIRSLFPLIARVDPVRAASFGRLEDAQGYRGYDPEAIEELNEVAEGGSVDDLLALVTKYPQMAPSIYWRAVNQAQANGDIERARKLANDFNGDAEFKRSMIQMIDRNESLMSAMREKIKNIQATLDSTPRVEDKVALLLTAATLIAPDDRKESQKLRDQAGALIDNMKPGKSQLEFRMGLALVYCSENNDRGLSTMESLVSKLNELIDAAARLDGYESHHLRDGEWNMSNEGAMGSLLTTLAENARYFAWCDFDRAVSIAGQFERPEIRLMAQLKLAQGILAGRPKSLRTQYPTRRY